MMRTRAVIDLRSDTATQPTEAMRAAIAAARVGDEQLGEDPTVLELEERTAAFLGREAAVFLPTATMANQIAIRVMAAPGEELIADHARARRLAERLAQSGVAVDLEQVETNFVHIDVGRHGLTAAVAISRLTDTGVLLSGTLRPTVLRAVTHLGIDDAAVDSAAEAIITTLNAGPARLHPDTEPLHRSGAHPHAISLGDT